MLPNYATDAFPDEMRSSIQEAPVSMSKTNTASEEVGAMWQSTRRLLDEFYAPHNEILANMLNDERFLWKETSTLYHKEH